MPASEPAPWEAIAGMNTSEAISGAAARTAQTGRQHRHAGLRAGTLRGVGGDGTGTMPTAAKGLRATLVLPFFQQQKKGRKECRRGIRLHPGMLARRTLKFINLPTASNSMNFGRARRWPAGRRIRRGRAIQRTATSGRGFAQTAHGRDAACSVSNDADSTNGATAPAQCNTSGGAKW